MKVELLHHEHLQPQVGAPRRYPPKAGYISPAKTSEARKIDKAVTLLA